MYLGCILKRFMHFPPISSNIYLILRTYPPWCWGHDGHDGHDHYVHDQSILFKLLWWIIFLTAVCHWEVWVSLSISSLLCGPPTIKLYQFKDKIWTFLNIYQTKFCWLHLDCIWYEQMCTCATSSMSLFSRLRNPKLKDIKNICFPRI